MEKVKFLRGILKKQIIAKILIFISILFLASTSTVNAKSMVKPQLSSTIVIWEEESGSGHYLGMVESLNEQLFSYSEDFVHTLVPKPKNGHHEIPMVHMDVFLEELRSDHKTYIILPYIVYYEIKGLLKWERHEVYSPVPLVIYQGETFKRFHIGTLGFGKTTYEDVIYPFRTGVADFHFIDNKWVKVESKESDIGYWYLDHSPYNFNLINTMLPSQIISYKQGYTIKKPLVFNSMLVVNSSIFNQEIFTLEIAKKDS